MSRGTTLKLTIIACLTALVVTACGTAQLPEILPSEDGNFLLYFAPSDAQVALVKEGSRTSGLTLRSAETTTSDGLGVLRYDLAAGTYLVRVAKSGYKTAEQLLEIPQGDTPDLKAEVDLTVELEPDPSAPTEPGDGDGDSVVSPAGFSLRGNPDFDVSTLSDEQRMWYERLWAGIRQPDKKPDIEDNVKSDDEYQFARNLFQYNRAVLQGLRVTGDLRLLDEVDRIAQYMRNSLYDGWCTDEDYQLYSFYGGTTVSSKDGFLNFRRMRSTSDVHHCRDVSDLEEALMHGHLAMIMYAYHVNRDLVSPSGIDYGERADFWQDYLRNHFEAKWRQRSGRSFPDMDFLNVKFCHTHAQFTLYHYYLGSVLADQGDSDAQYYLSHAKKMTDQYFDEPHIPGEQAGGFVDVSTPLGPAVVYAFGTPYGTGSPEEQACPTVYARYAVEAIVELHLEGFYRWADDSIMEKLGNGIAHFVMDTYPVGGSSDPLAASVVGNSSAGGIMPTDYRNRLNEAQSAYSTFGTLAAWQKNDKIEDVTKQIYRAVEADVNSPRSVFIPASMLFAASAD